MEIDEIYIDPAEARRQIGLDSSVPCDLCIDKTKDITEAFSKIAAYLCFECKLYLCANCYAKGHAKHASVCATSEARVKDRKIEQFVDTLLKETSTSRRKNIKTEKYSPAVVDSVNINHQFDEKNCHTTGLCGLKSGRWVVSDFKNRSIKIIKLGSNVMERYICLSYQPFDVTEICVNQIHTDSDLATEETQMGTDTLLAVTVPFMHLIVYINLNETPPALVKSIFTEGNCFGIEFCDGRIYTTVEWLSSRSFVSILSIDGTVLKYVECMINLKSANFGYSYLAVSSPDTIYALAGSSRDTVLCINSEGVITSQITMRGVHLSGISAGNDKSIYVCSRDKHNVYRLDEDLKQLKPVLDKKYSRYMKDTHFLCCIRDRLYVSRLLYPSGLPNFVTLIRLYE